VRSFILQFKIKKPLLFLTGRYMQLPSGQRDKHQGIRFPIPAGRARPLGVTVFANARIL